MAQELRLVWLRLVRSAWGDWGVMPDTRSRVEECFKLSRGWWSIRDVMGAAHTSYTLTRLALNAMRSEGLLEARPRSGNNTKPEGEWRVIG